MTRKTALPHTATVSLPQLAVCIAMRVAMASVIGLWLIYDQLERGNINQHSDIIYVAGAFSAGLILLWQWYTHYRKLTGILHHILTQWHASQSPTSPFSRRARGPMALLTELTRLAEQAIETHRQHMHLRMQLSASQHTLAGYQSLSSLHGDMRHLFARIAEYTVMLEDTIARRASISCLHEAFDELGEQSFNLQLFVTAFERLNQPTTRSGWVEIIDPTHTLSRVLVPLAASLDRRCMLLSSTAWNERIRTKIASNDLELIVWLTLLGTVRYAADESTLVLSCEPAADGSSTIITCLVSELAPAAMSPHERADFMREKQKYQSAHMFAHTLAGSTNLTLAAQLTARAGGILSVHARTQTSCLIELSLPC